MAPLRVAVVAGGRLVQPDGGPDVPWWSFTKTATAVAALALVRDGRLALDTPIRGRPYTVRQLLRHESGLADYGGLAEYHAAVSRGDPPWPVAELLRRADARRLRFPPGAGWGYSNIGYLMVVSVIERAADADFASVLDRMVLRPLGIVGARLARGTADLQDGSAAGYDPGWAYPGLIVGPLGEAALLLDRLLGGALLGGALSAAMLEARRLASIDPGRPMVAPGYGLGLMRDLAGGGQIGHSGAGPGSVIAVYRRERAPGAVTVAVTAGGADQDMVERVAFDAG